MNEENSYESDISEGWSLIDINLNEESMNSSETKSLAENEKGLQSDLVNSKLKEATSLHSINSSKNILKNKVESTSSSLNNFSSDDSPPNHEILTNSKDVLVEGKDSTMSEAVNDSCDAESIEILDIDESYQDSDIDNLDVAVIQKQDLDGSDHSSNKESLCDEYNTHHFSGLRRKRRKLSRDSESSADNFDSEIASSNGRHSCKTKVLKIQNCKQHVYRHYRNNVANTVLNLSMRVIFAGVACIAIGHFLGVHDGEGTAGELYDTLKKVQMENIALQSRLSQLNRALFTREVASKWESTLNKPPCNKNSNLEPEKPETDHTSQPEVQPDLNSVEWLVKVHKLVQKGCQNNEMVDVNKITDYIQNLMTFLKSDKNDNNRIQVLEETNAKISKVLQKMVVKLSSSQENLDNLYSRFLKLKDKFNKKVSKFFPDLVDDEYGCHGQECTGFDGKAGKDLNSIRWNPPGKTTESTILIDKPKQSPDATVSLCIFPQSEEYYHGDGENFSKQENSSTSIVDEEVTGDGNANEEEIPRNEEVIAEVEEERVRKEEKSDETEETKREKENKIEKKQKEKKVRGGKTKRDLNERDWKGKQFSSQQKRSVYRLKTKNVKRDEKTSRRKFVDSDPKETHSKKTKRGSGEEKVSTKKHSKPKRQVVRQEIKIGKRKRKSLSFPKESWTGKGKQGVWLEPERFFDSQFHPKEEFNTEDRVLDGKFVNFTGDWFFRLSKGRDEFRRRELLSDWQFERAKARMGWRNGDRFNTNWQFLRALAREDGRMEKLSNSRK